MISGKTAINWAEHMGCLIKPYGPEVIKMPFFFNRGEISKLPILSVAMANNPRNIPVLSTKIPAYPLAIKGPETAMNSKHDSWIVTRI